MTLTREMLDTRYAGGSTVNATPSRPSKKF